MSYNSELQNNNAELQEILDEVNNLPEAETDTVKYVPQTLTEAQKSQARVNIAALGKADISLGIASDGLIYIFVNGMPVGTGIPQGQSGDIHGYIDENNHIVFTGNMPDGTYTASYEDENGSIVGLIGQLAKDTNVYYTVTSNLSNCTNSNGTKTVVKGESYSATISANSGYELKSVVVTMGGSPVSVSGGNINIASVTGNIVITAVAEEVQTSGYTNLANPNDAYWKDGYRLSIGSGGTAESAGNQVTNFIPAEMDDTLYIKGMKIAVNAVQGDLKIVMYSTKDTESSKLGGMYGTTDTNAKTSFGSKVTVNGDVSVYKLFYDNNGTQVATSAMKYIRIQGTLLDGYTKDDVVITINEPIE